MPTHCFTYGTLMCADIMSEVCARPLRGEPASLTGFVRRAVRGEDYPGIRPAEGAMVDGVLYRDLDTIALKRLDAFEGEQYERLSVEVVLADGNRAVADTYVIKSEYAGLLLARDWCFDAFLAEGKQRFTSRYSGFFRI